MAHSNALRLFGVIALLCGAGALGACTPTNKVGSTETSSPRITIMPQVPGVQMDSGLLGTKPALTPTVNNVDWPQAGYTATHMSPNATLTADKPKEIWRENIGEGANSDHKILATPVIADGRVYTMDAIGNISARDAMTGDHVWDFESKPADTDDDAIGGGIGIGNGLIYVTTGFGEVIALHPNDGSVAWRRSLSNPFRAAPTITNDHIYVVSIDNQLNALDARTGEVLWHHSGIAENATLMGASNPAVVDQSVVIAYSSGEIYDLRSENGRVSWNYTLSTPTQVGALPAIADIRGLPVLDHGRIFAISHSGRMASVEERSGERVWEADIGGITSPVVDGDTVFVVSNDRQLVALARDSGRVMWKHDLQRYTEADDKDSPPVYWSGVLLAGNTLWAGNTAGQLTAFSPADGTELGSIDIDDPVSITPIAANGILYIVTDNGDLVALK